jgi:hypothetical protein
MNPALKQLFKFNHSGTNANSNIDNLACWFEEYGTTTYNTEKAIRLAVNYKDIHDKLLSPSEDCFTFTSKLDQNNEFNTNPKIKSDLGIFARISKNGYKYIIIAGIHGSGTWIIASFLNNHLYGKYKNEDKFNKIFFDEKDFIAVIFGYFDTKKLVVDEKR